MTQRIVFAVEHLQLLSAALELDFTPDEAAQQVEVAINWGRYAELLAYDDTSATLYIETGTTAPTIAG